MLNKDYKDILRALNDEKVSFLLVGAYAMAAHGYPRATMVLDDKSDPVSAEFYLIEYEATPLRW